MAMLIYPLASTLTSTLVAGLVSAFIFLHFLLTIIVDFVLVSTYIVLIYNALMINDIPNATLAFASFSMYAVHAGIIFA